MSKTHFELIDHHDGTCSITFLGTEDREITLILDVESVHFLSYFLANLHVPQPDVKKALEMLQ